MSVILSESNKLKNKSLPDLAFLSLKARQWDKQRHIMHSTSEKRTFNAEVNSIKGETLKEKLPVSPQYQLKIS
jgi:hypothetical protein